MIVIHHLIEPQVNKRFYTPLVVSMEVSMTDVVMKSITDSLGKQVNKSDELAKEWKSNISNLDTFIKGLSAWKRVIGYTACLLTIGAFLWKMGALLAIPNFLSNMIRIVPAILPSGGIHPVKEISKEGMSNTLHTMMETPLTPLTIVASIGILTLGIGTLKIIAWILQRSPK